MNSRIPRERERERQRFCFYDVVTLGYMQPEVSVSINGKKTIEQGKIHLPYQKKGVVYHFKLACPSSVLLRSYVLVYPLDSFLDALVLINHDICLAW